MSRDGKREGDSRGGERQSPCPILILICIRPRILIKWIILLRTSDLFPIEDREEVVNAACLQTEFLPRQRKMNESSPPFSHHSFMVRLSPYFLPYNINSLNQAALNSLFECMHSKFYLRAFMQFPVELLSFWPFHAALKLFLTLTLSINYLYRYRTKISILYSQSTRISDD